VGAAAWLLPFGTKEILTGKGYEMWAGGLSFYDRFLFGPHAEGGILKGKIAAVCRSAKKGFPKQDILSGFFEKGQALFGDAHAGTEKEVSILLKEKVDQLSRKTGLTFPAGAFAENLLVEGLDQDKLIPGQCLKVGKVILQIQQVGKEAGTQHSYQYQGYSLLPHFGIFAKVIQSGMVKNGAEVELLNSAP
jgi:MOSC domain-containing protein YiiM